MVAVANEMVAITTACRFVGMHVPDDIDYGRSMKVRCPFGEVYHSDSGAEAAMRVYIETNSAFCFRCGVSYSPVKLAAQAWDLSFKDAAVELLERIGHKPVSLADAWLHASTRDTAPDRTMLGEALKMFCARVAPDWDDAQFDPAVAAKLTRCLALLDLVNTEDDARTWLAGCKTAMATSLQPTKALPSASH